MTIDDFLARLERVKKSGAGHSARCPAHKDRSPSLSVTEGEKGIVAICHKGCSVEAICSAVGCKVSDLFYDADNAGREIAAVYDYVDEEGHPLFQAVRYYPKGFSQRLSESKWGLNGVRRVPYHLNEIHETTKAVWVVEGEKDADALRELGFVATCNPMGAGKWDDEYATYFAGVPWVLVVPDCDEPGRKHGRDVAASFLKRQMPVKILDLERADGYDVSDFIAEHGESAAHELRQLAQNAQRWTGKEKPPLPIQSVSTFLANVPPYDEDKDYLGAFLHGGNRVHIAGPIGHGKTSFLLEAVSAAVRGDDFLGFQGKGGLKARLVDLEMPSELLGQAVRDARLEGVDGFELVHLPDGLRIDTHPEDRRLLEAVAEDCDLLVIDPFYKLMEHEMEYSATRAINACLDGIRHRHPNLCTLVGFHAQEPAYTKEALVLTRVSGFKVFQRAADVVLLFQRIEEDTSWVHWAKNRSPRLDVKYMERWTVEWERGCGFRRSDGEGAPLRNIAEDEEAEFGALFG